MTRYHSKLRRSLRSLSITVSLAGSLMGLILMPGSARADEADMIKPEPLVWARVDFLRNRVQLLPRQAAARQARISDLLSVGDSLRTLRRSRAELRFNDDSLARIGERATFRFTPNTRNFQLTNGTVLLLIPPERGRTTIQTPNAVTGIQGSALFVRYIPETDTTIVGALTDNPDGPMVLFNRDGSEQQALEANQIGVIEGDQITQLYRFDSQLFWESSGLAEGIDYSQDASPDASDPLDGVRQEIREAISKEDPFLSEGEGVIENPASFSRPDSTESASTNTPEVPASTESSDNPTTNSTTTTNGTDSSPSETQSTAGGETANNGAPNGGTATDGTASTPVAGQTDVGQTSSAPPSGANDSPQAAIPPSPLTAEPNIEDLDLGDVGGVEEPVVELEFEGTPAEAYLAIPLPRPLKAPQGDSSNSLEPTSPDTSSGGGSQGTTRPANATPAGSGSTPAGSSSTPAGSSSTPAGSISTPASSTPAVTAPPAQSTPIPSLQLPIDHDSPSGAILGRPPSTGASPNTPRTGAALTAPPASSGENSVPANPPVSPPANPPVSPPTDPPILPEGTQTPDSAEPVGSTGAPVLDPSNSLVPVESGAPPATTDVLPPATDPALLLDDNSEDEAVADPTGTEIETPPQAAEGVESPEVIIPETVATPTVPAAIDSTATDAPFEPEVGGSSLENVLDPIDLPTDLPGDVPPPTGDSMNQGGDLSGGNGDTPTTGGQTPGQEGNPSGGTNGGRVLL